NPSGSAKHVGLSGRFLQLGLSRIPTLLGFSKWLAHVDVFARGHGDLPGAVQSIFALLHPRIGCASGMAHLAYDDLGRNMGQRPRVSERQSNLNYRRLLCDARLSRVVDRDR